MTTRATEKEISAHLCKLRLRVRGKPLDPKEERDAAMASYHLAVKTLSRSAGRSATAAAAYRAGAGIADQREGVVHDYTRRSGVDHTQIVLPADAPTWASDRAALWNAAEAAETRKNSTVAREFEIALPVELSAQQRQDLVLEFAREISDRHQVAVDVAIHAPGAEGDNRNHHAHLLLTTRQLGPEGLGAKTRELDVKTSGEVDHWRARWAEVQNLALERAGSAERVDHRSHAERGLEDQPLPELTRAEYQLERAEKKSAQRDQRDYQPVTTAGAQRQAVEERRGLRAYVEKGAEWLKQASASVGQTMQNLAASMAGKITAEAQAKDRQARIERELQRQKEKQLQEQIKAQRDRDGKKPDRGMGR